MCIPWGSASDWVSSLDILSGISLPMWFLVVIRMHSIHKSASQVTVPLLFIDLGYFHPSVLPRRQNWKLHLSVSLVFVSCILWLFPKCGWCSAPALVLLPHCLSCLLEYGTLHCSVYFRVHLKYRLFCKVVVWAADDLCILCSQILQLGVSSRLFKKNYKALCDLFYVCFSSHKSSTTPPHQEPCDTPHNPNRMSCFSEQGYVLRAHVISCWHIIHLVFFWGCGWVGLMVEAFETIPVEMSSTMYR